MPPDGLSALDAAELQGAGLAPEQASQVLRDVREVIQGLDGQHDEVQVRCGAVPCPPEPSTDRSPTSRRSLTALSQVWREVSKAVLRPDLPFAAHKLFFEAVYAGWRASERGPPPAWVPKAEGAAETNAAAFMRDFQVGGCTQRICLYPPADFQYHRARMNLA